MHPIRDDESRYNHRFPGMNKIFILTLVLLSSLNAHAGRTWTDSLSDWSVYMDNGVTYVRSGSMPSACAHDRAQIDTSSEITYGTTTYSESHFRDMYAFILMSYASSKELYIVTDSAESSCRVYGVKNKKY